MVKITIDRQKQHNGEYTHDANGNYTYEVFRQTADKAQKPIPSRTGESWNIKEIYEFVHDRADLNHLPVDFGEGVMHDFMQYADVHEQKELRKAQKEMAGAKRISRGELHKLLSQS
jgi:hypothetical protein